MLATKRPLSRRVIMPLIILIVGGGVAIWASQAERSRIGRMEDSVRRLCILAASGEDLIDRLNTVDRYLNQPVAEAMQEACAGLADRPDAIIVTVVPDDAPGFGDGSATHTAMIRIDGADRLGLRLMERDDDILIAGFWMPSATGD